MSEPAIWWQTTEAKVEAIARKVALRHAGRDADTPCIAYEPHRVDTPSGSARVVSLGELRPLWTYYIGVARMALEAADHVGDDEVLGDTPLPHAGLFADQHPTPDEQWRRDTGLDAGGGGDGPTSEDI